MDKILALIDQNRDNSLSGLIELLKIQSISSEIEHKNDMIYCADWLVEHFSSIGLNNCRTIENGEGHPLVYAQWLGAGSDAKTVLIYGHYDVQPVDPLNEWISSPFEPRIENNKIFCRGTADDKGQFFIHVKAVEYFLKAQGSCPVNIKFIIEGEEEAGSSSINDFIAQNTDLLSCDAVLISDTEWFADNLPSICYGLRGLSYMEINVQGPNRDLHSGSFGGAVDNPAIVLSKIIAQLHDENGRITVPGFYDDLIEASIEERNDFLRLNFDEAHYKADLNIKALGGEKEFTTLERVWVRPSLDVNGIWSGYIGDGVKTVLPAKAGAKISCRLVANQNPEKIFQLVSDYILSLAPPSVHVTVKYMHGGNPVLVPKQNSAISAAAQAFRHVFNIEPVFIREGGSIPVVETLSVFLKAPVVLMGFGLPGDNIHSPNENFDLNNFFNGIKVSALFFEYFASK
ncbi:MAG: dipeptidase [Candidatus Kapabacteria bacterium]|nr:dipeptidase [Candidatus Kapabacteria bacterium]